MENYVQLRHLLLILPESFIYKQDECHRSIQGKAEQIRDFDRNAHNLFASYGFFRALCSPAT